MPAVGRHFLADYYGCTPRRLNDADGLRRALLDAVAASGATILSHHFEVFQPHGVTGVVVIAESHVALHTWPEHGFMAIDYFTCSERLDARLTLDLIGRAIEAERVEMREVARGEGVKDRVGEAPAIPANQVNIRKV
ncbi:MAG: adenosylmethionine decarboxylase [Polyangiaceae bacterium]|nr:adenosylmethionine decarboxylase [Polyangiaceae bacterium]